VRAEYEEVVREIEGDLSELQWRGLCLPRPVFVPKVRAGAAAPVCGLGWGCSSVGDAGFSGAVWQHRRCPHSLISEENGVVAQPRPAGGFPYSP